MKINLLIAVAYAIGLTSLPTHAFEWLPVTPEELQLTTVPDAPGAAAVYLYRQVDRDDNGPSEFVYYRIKILAEPGRKYGNLEIQYYQDYESIRNIEARTIRPDGTVVTFSGQIFDKPLGSAYGRQVAAKVLTLPEASVGCIVEYQFRREMARNRVFDSQWILNANLFTRHAKFTLDAYRGYGVRWSWPQGLPKGTDPPKESHGLITLEVHDVPAFVSEENMPPADVLKYRVDFVYFTRENDEKEPIAYWKRYGRQRFREAEGFIGAPRILQEAVVQIVAPGDTPEVKLRKIYARVQQIRNLSYERDKTEQERLRDNLRPIVNAAEVWQRGYGRSEDIAWLMLGLVRAAGFQADAAEVATRDRNFFDAAMMNDRDLNGSVVIVSLDGRDLFLDPGTVFAPFGVLAWNKTAVNALRLSRDGGSWIATPVPAAADSSIDCRAVLSLNEEGSVEGKLAVRFTGLEALVLRIDERNEDAVSRKRHLEELMSGLIPVRSYVTLENEPDWASSTPALVAEFNVRVPGWAGTTGSRWLVPAALFGGGEAHYFEHSTRLWPVYFLYPHRRHEEVTINILPSMSVGSLPRPQALDLKMLAYKLGADAFAGGVRLERQVDVNTPIIPVKLYDSVRSFFQTVRTGDVEQVVLVSTSAAGRN
jgi:hypothetical protein